MSNEKFVKLINPVPSECEDIDIFDVLLGGSWIIGGKKYEEYGHVFDYNFVNETTTQERTFVFVETTVDNIERKMFVDFNLHVCIFAHKNVIRITDKTTPNIQETIEMGYPVSNFANRIDVLCDIVDSMLNGVNDVPGLGRIEPSSRNYISIFQPNFDYYGKILKYHISNLDEGGESCYEN